jgi:hypothetical protein
MTRVVLLLGPALAILTVSAPVHARPPAVPAGAVAPVPPQPVPVVPEAIQRQASIEASGGLAVAPGRLALARLNEDFRLGLSGTRLDELGKRIDDELYPGMAWRAADLPTLLDGINRFLGLGIDPVKLDDYGRALQAEMEGPPREADVDRRPRPAVQWWDESANTSGDLSGSTLVLVVLLKVPGSTDWDNSFPWYHISTACGRAGDGMKFYKGKAPSQADVSYEVRYYKTTISTSPASHDSCDMQWMEDAFTNLGYGDWDADGTILDDAARYVRDLYDKDNCLILFVPKEGGRSYACRGGRWTHAGPHATVFFYSTWPIQKGWEVYAHEMGHLFGACDEYYQSSDNTGCDYDDPDNIEGEGCDDPCKLTHTPFRPWALNGNCDKCTDAVDCIMNNNDDAICTYTRAQFGWHDHDGDGIIDAVDDDPANEGPACNNGAPEITPPNSQVLGLADVQSSGATFTVYWSGTDVCGGVTSYDVDYKAGAGAWTRWKTAVTSTSAPFTGSDFHTYYFRSRARDGYDNEEAWPAGPDATTTVMVGAPPAPVISSSTHGTDTGWYDDNDPRFSWTVPVGSDLPLEDLLPSFSWDITRGAMDTPDDAYDGPGPTVSFTNLADGTWWFHVKGKDWTGTWGATGHRRIRIDTSGPPAPVISSDTHPTGTVWYNNGTLAVQWPEPPDSSGIAGYSIAGPDDDPYTTPGTSINLSANNADFFGLATGVWYVHVRAVDNLGHWGPAGHFKFQVDRTPPPPPTVTSATHPNGGTWYSGNDPSFSWTAPEDESGIGGYSYHESATSGDSPDHASEGVNPATFFTDVADGQRYFHIVARDNAVPPNWSTSVTHFGYRVDTVVPGPAGGLGSTSHDAAIGQWNNPQSADNTVEAHWTAATDPPPGAGVGGYSIVWDHAAATLPDQTAELGGGATGVTSAPLADGTDNWFHIRSRDAARNWDDAAAHLGPFYINTEPPEVPSGFWATPGNSRMDLDWWDNGDPDFAGFLVYRSTVPGSGYVQLTTTPIFTSQYADLTVLNGIEYYYVVTATDSVGNESNHSVERHGMPEYQTPGTGAGYTLAQLVAVSNNGVAGGGGAFTMNGSVTISASDTLSVSSGETLRSSDTAGVRKLIVNGTLLATGGGGGWVTFGSTGGGPGRWGGIEISAGSGGVMDSCIVEGAVDGVHWIGTAASITHCTVRYNSGTGISVQGLPGAVCGVSWNDVYDNGVDGIYVIGDAGAAITVTDNTVEDNGDDGVQYTVFGAMPPALLSISANTILRNTGDGITCGQGTGPISIQNNDIRENDDGIVMDGEAWGARPTIQFNNIQANRRAGIHCANLAMPTVDTNTIVGNLAYGLYSKTLAEPILINNTVTGSQYGVYITQYAAAPVPDLGSAANQSGQNKIHGHSQFSVYNNTPFGVRAQGNWWGAAATLQMATNPPPPVLGNVNEIWDVFDQPGLGMVDYANWLNLGDTAPTIAITSPAAGPAATVDTSFVVTWTDSDPEEDAQINLFYDPDAAGLDGTPLEGGSGLSEDDAADSLLWNTARTPRGTYYVYGIIDDGFTSVSSYSAGQVTVDHAAIAVAPDTISLIMTANAVGEDTVTVSNLSDNYALHFEASVTDTTGAGVAWATLSPDTGTVAPGASAELTLRVETDGFAAGAYPARVRFTSNDPLDSLVVAPAVLLDVAYPVSALSDIAHDFGALPVGSQADWSFKVFNTGTAPLVAGGVSFTDGAFSLLGASFPDTVADGDSTTYTIRFAVSELGPLSTSMSLTTDDPYDSTLSISLQGSGFGPDIALSAASHAFGPRAYGDSTTWAFTIGNEGNDTLAVASVSSDHADYVVVSPAFPDTLAPGDTVAVTVRYRALTEGSTSATLTVTSDDPDEGTLGISLTGAVNKPEVAVAPASHAFGTVRVDSDSTWAFTVRNAGTGDLVFQEIIGDNPDYAWSGASLPDTLAPAESLVVSVTFTPFASGASDESLGVHTDDAETPEVTVILTGTGGMPALAAADSSHDFGDVLTTEYEDWDLKLRNPGTVGVRVDSMTVSDDDYDAVGAFPIDIAAGDSALVTVRFSPASAGSLSATLTLHSDDITHPMLWVALDGRGVSPEMTLSASSHNFGEVLLGGYADWTLEVVNQGNHDLEVSQCDPDSAAFTVVSPAFPQVLAPAGSLDVLVRFTPSGEEPATGALHLHADDPADSVRAVPMVGTGIWPDLFRTPYEIDAVSFEGEESIVPLDIRNVGTGSLGFVLSENDSIFAASIAPAPASKLGGLVPATMSVATLQGLTDLPWLSISPTGDTLGTGEARTVAVGCDAAPVGQGVYKGSLRLDSSDPDSALLWVPVRMRVPRMRYADHTTQSVVFTVTDEGCYGFYDHPQYLAYGEGYYGNGFRFQGLASGLWHASFWVGKDSLHVVDGSYDYDWEATAGGHLVIQDLGAEYGRARFTDASAPSPVGVEVSQVSVALPSPPRDDFVVLQYTVHNRTGSTITGIHTGLYLDWDVADYANDAGGYSAPEALGYMYDALMPDSTYYGVCLISPPSPRSFQLVHNPTYVHPTGNIADSLKWGFLSDGVKDAATWENTDWSVLMSTGPHTLAAGDSVTVIYAVLAGENLADLKANAVEARDWHQTAVPPEEPPVTTPAVVSMSPAFPNPFHASVTFELNLPAPGRARLEVFDLRGRLVRRLVDGPMDGGITRVNWDGRDEVGRTVATGIYFCRFVAGERVVARKLVLVR